MIQAMNQQALPAHAEPFRGSILAVWKYSPAFIYHDEEPYETIMANVLDPEGIVKVIALASSSGMMDDAFKIALDVRPDASPEIIAKAKKYLNDHTREMLHHGLTPAEIASAYLSDRWIKNPKGLIVEIVRGRKFPKGDQGEVIAYGDGQYGAWFRIKLFKDGSEIFISKGNVETISTMQERWLFEATEISYEIQAEAIRHATDFFQPIKTSGCGRYSGAGWVEEPGFTISNFQKSIPGRMNTLLRKKQK